MSGSGRLSLEDQHLWPVSQTSIRIRSERLTTPDHSHCDADAERGVETNCARDRIAQCSSGSFVRRESREYTRDTRGDILRSLASLLRLAEGDIYLMSDFDNIRTTILTRRVKVTVDIRRCSLYLISDNLESLRLLPTYLAIWPWILLPPPISLPNT